MHSRVISMCAVVLFSAGVKAQSRLTLEDAISEAMQRNTALLAEKANIPIAEARILTASLRPNPVLSLSGGHLDLLGTGFSDANGGGPTEFTVHTDYTIERGGKRQARTDVARAARTVTELQFQNTARNLILDVQNAFIDVLLAKETMALATQNMEALNRIVDINAARLKAGDIAEVELIRVRLAALQYENSVSQAQLRVSTTASRLQTVIGRPKPLAIEVIGDLQRTGAVPDLEELQRLAAETRPDLRALSKDVDRAGAEFRSQVAQGKVDYVVGAEYVRQQVNAQANALGFTFEVPLPVYNRNQGEIARAREEQRQAELRVRASQSSIAGEVDAAYSQYLTARRLLENIERKMLQQARDVRDITEFSYRRGDATLLELLDAQRAFNETMQAYIEARAEHARSLYLLEAVSGKVVTK